MRGNLDIEPDEKIKLENLINIQPFPKGQILDSSKWKESDDDNSKFDENGRKVLKKGRHHCGKRRNC